MEQYEEYQDSDVDWIGRIPIGWNLVKLKRIVDMKSGNFISAEMIEDNGLYPVYGGNGIRGYHSEFTHDGYFPLIGRQGALCGNVNYAKGKFWPTEHAVVVSSKKQIDTYWIGELLRLMNLNQYSQASAQPGLSVEKIMNLHIPLPLPSEQIKIAQYLEHQTTIVDQLIRKKETLIGKLKEKRQAIINEAVTKGLDFNTKMKDSGIEWLGKMPLDWEIVKLKFVAKLNPSKSEINTSLNAEDSVSFLPMEKVGEDWSYDKSSVAPYGSVSTGLTYFREGDIIIAKITPCFENGKATILDSLSNGIGFGSTEFHTIRPIHINNRFLFYVTRSDYFMTSGESFMTGSAGQKRVPTSFVNDFYVPVPSIPEQQIIVDYIEEYISRSNVLVSHLMLQIEKLKEYRQSLISEAVTGKIDVSDWEPKN